MAQVELDGKYGFIDKTGNEIISCKYDRIFRADDGNDVEIDGKCGFVDNAGKEVVPCEYGSVRCLGDNFFQIGALVRNNLKYGIIDASGKQVVAAKYKEEDTMSCLGESVVINKSEVCHIIGKDGKEVGKYDMVCDVVEGMANVKLNDKWGFVDAAGKEVVSCKYDGALHFSDGFAAVKVGEQWGVIDKTGNEVIPCKYDALGYFHDGIARVELGGKYGFIDATGAEVIPCKYDTYGECITALCNK